MPHTFPRVGGATMENEIRPVNRRGIFDRTINLGHVLTIITLLGSVGALIMHDQERFVQLETRVNYLDDQNLPPRMAAVEAQTQNLRDSLTDIRDVLIQIRNSLDTKADKRH
jgi:hypothetical protein